MWHRAPPAHEFRRAKPRHMSAAHLVSTEWLAARMDDPAIRIVDVRGHLRWEQRDTATPWQSARRNYEAAHIPGSVYIDFTSDLVNMNDPVPLQVAPFAKLQQMLGDKGIGDEHLVVAYDADRSIFATRLWWIFRLCGHTNMRVLDGGWLAWQGDGRPVSSETPHYLPAKFTIQARQEYRADIEEIRRSLRRSDVTLLDARANEDFRGNPKWSDRGGHIPGAINLPASTLLNADGTFRSIAELRDLVNARHLPSDARVVTYCGLGLAATAVAFALDMLGFRNVSVFDGSWAEWGSRKELPCAVGDAT
jgi:thiosulfate/3-mercaptopyruvate sulfurtransferase